ncbi:MAG: hypothetical protein CL396_09970, partial [Acidiferrobacteraceae bacterium]|nr:hypothetical protein [Acidiferrobacteraceae bacterium]
MLLSSGCLGNDDVSEETSNSVTTAIELVVWSTYEVDSKEEETFLSTVDEWMETNPGIEVKVEPKPFLQAVNTYRVAALGGQAPDLMRFSNDQLGSIAPIRDRGSPLLEDLRPWLSPVQREIWDSVALQSMRYEGDLLALPVSQDCVSLFYNKALFDEEGMEYPNDGWTTADMLDAAQQLTFGEQVGISIPTKDPYRWFALNSGHGGTLFTDSGVPNLDGEGSAQAMEFWLSLELEHGIVPTGTNIETMKNHFVEGRAAMIIDGPWQWPTYEKAKIDIGQALLPIVEETGLRMSPMVGFKGWSISKQSPNKAAAVALALYLSSEEVQKVAAKETRTMPVIESLYVDEELLADDVLAG